MSSNRGLGKGLGALLGPAALENDSSSSLLLPISQIENYVGQPRKNFDDEALADLAESIREHGVIQPLTVRKLASGYYQIIAGERRWRAARMAGLTEVPVLIIEADDRKAMELALIENLQRQDLNPLEEAQGYQTLMEQYGLTQEEVATRVSKSRPAVANALRLLGLCSEVRTLVERGQLSAGHARALLPLSASQQQEAAKTIQSHALSVRQTELLVKKLQQEKKEPSSPSPAVDYAREAEKDLSEKLGRGCRIVTGRKKGRIELEFYDTDDLNDLLDALSAMKKRSRPLS